MRPVLDPGRFIVVGALIALLGLPRAPLRAQQSSLPGGAIGADGTPIDPCVIAPLEQFRFLIAAGLGRAVPITRTTDGERMTISSLVISGVRCAPMRAEMHAEVKRWTPDGRSRDSTSAVVHFIASMLGGASFRGDSIKASQSRTASSLSKANLCVRDIEITRSELRAGTAIAPALARAWLADALHEQCFDITSLVYVHLQRGGTIARPR